MGLIGNFSTHHAFFRSVACVVCIARVTQWFTQHYASVCHILTLWTSFYMRLMADASSPHTEKYERELASKRPPAKFDGMAIHGHAWQFNGH